MPGIDVTVYTNIAHCLIPLHCLGAIFKSKKAPKSKFSGLPDLPRELTALPIPPRWWRCSLPKNLSLALGPSGLALSIPTFHSMTPPMAPVVTVGDWGTILLLQNALQNARICILKFKYMHRNHEPRPRSIWRRTVIFTAYSVGLNTNSRTDSCVRIKDIFHERLIMITKFVVNETS